MKRTTEQLLTWAPLGVGLALMMSRHRRLGLAIAAVSPLTVVTLHPRGTRRALRKVPKALARASRQVGKKVACGAKETGKSIRWVVG
ncbi:MAG: hypothetical protein ACRD1C_04120 [Terriglobales bacterium]